MIQQQAAKVLLIDPEGFYLLLERNRHPRFGNDPDLPGGTVEAGEDLKIAAIREVMEEVGVDITDNPTMTRLYTGNEYAHSGMVFGLFTCQLDTRPDISLSWEHTGFEWLTRDGFVAKAGGAVDSYMHMVHDVLVENPYLTTWQSGRESNLLDDIIAGRKTIEGRLNRDKFARYEVGDIISLRRDIRGDDMILRDGMPDAARVKITAIRQYPDFLSLVTQEGYSNVIPSAASNDEAADEYNKYYGKADQEKFGVLAIQVQLLEQE